MLIIVNRSVIWFACIQRSICISCRTPPSSKWHANPIVWIDLGFGQQNWLSWQHSLRDRKTNFRSFTCSHRSANPANLARIGLVDVQIIGLTESLKIKNNYKTKAEHKPAFGPGDLTRHWCIAGSAPGIPCTMDSSSLGHRGLLISLS